MYKKYFVALLCIFSVHSTPNKRASACVRLYEKVAALCEKDPRLFSVLAAHLKINAPLSLSELQRNALDSQGLLPGKNLEPDDSSFIANSIIYDFGKKNYTLGDCLVKISEK
jgi:hypothetical protein